MKNKTVRIGTVFFLVVAAAVLAAVGTYYYVSGIVNDIGNSQQMYLNLSNVERIVVSNYINSIDTSTGYANIQDGIISGYIDGLGDQNSYYLNEKNYVVNKYTNTNTQIESGITPIYDKSTQCVRVLSVKRGSPAALAGVNIGDIIMRLDGVSVTEIGYKNAVAGLAREPGETCEVEILRADSAELISVTLYFNAYTINTVSYSFLGNGVGYIYISEFDNTTPSAFRDAYTVLSSGDGTNPAVSSLIIDVRSNAAGDFDSMIEVADYIMPATTICTRRERDSSQNTLYTSSSENYTEMDIVVLQNARTSGVSEVFSAALQDNNLAVVIGETSAGTGLAQREIPLSNNTAIVLSVYEYIRPSGESFNGIGVTPNYQSQLDSSKLEQFPELDHSQDDQLQYALTYLMNGAA